MDMIRIFCCATLAATTFCYTLEDFIIYDDINLKPIAWNNDDFTIIFRNNRTQVKLFDIEMSLEQLFKSTMFLAGKDKNLLVIRSNSTIKIIDLPLTSSLKKFENPERKNFTYAPQTNADRLWRFEELEYNRYETRKFILVESVNIEGEVDPPSASLELTLDSGRDWKFISMFEWRGTIYAAFLMDEEESIVIGVDPLTNERNASLDELIKAFLPRVYKLVSMTLIPSNKPLINMRTKKTLYSGDFVKILSSFPKLLDSCSQEEQTFCDLSAYLSDHRPPNSDYCQKDRIPLFVDYEVQIHFCVELGKLDSPLSYHLSHGVDRNMLMITGEDELQICKFESCYIATDEFLENCDTFNLTKGAKPLQPFLDTRTANLIFPIRENGVIVEHVFPIIQPSDLLNCPNCMILGYHHDFTWSQSSGCYKKGASNVPQVNVCQREAVCTRQLTSKDQVELTIQFDYELQINFGEKAFVVINDTRYNVTSTKTNAYKAIVPNKEAQIFRIQIWRSTGGPMETSFRIIEEKNVEENYWVIILLILTVLLLTGLTVSNVLIIAKRLSDKRKSEENSPQSVTLT